MIQNCSSGDLQSFYLANGITLLQVLIELNWPEKLDDFLHEVPYHDAVYRYNEDVHPLKMVYYSQNQKVAELMARHLKGKNSIIFEENLFWLYKGCLNKNLRDVVLSSLFSHGVLQLKNAPDTALMNEDDLPIIKKSPKKNLKNSEILEMIKTSDTSETFHLKICRSAFKSEWNLLEPFVRRYIKMYWSDPSKIVDNDSRFLIEYIWSRYSWLSKTITFFFLNFTFFTAISLVWCSSKESSQTFFAFTDSHYPYYILNGCSLLTFMLILILELAVFIKRKGQHLKSYYNQLDFLVLSFYLPINILAKILNSELFGQKWEGLVAAYIAILCIRAFTQLRSIDRIRYLIAMLQRIFKDMIPIFTIAGFTIFSLSLINA